MNSGKTFPKTDVSRSTPPRRRRACGFAFVLFCIANTSLAHDPGLSTATARLHTNNLEVTLAIPVRDAAQLAPLDADRDGSVSKEEFENGKARFASAVTNGFRIELDGAVKPPASVLVWLESNNDAYCTLTFPGRALSRFKAQSQMLDDLPPGHRQFFTFDPENGASRVERLLSRNENSVTIEVGTAPSIASDTQAEGRQSFAGFLALGVKHILTGYDHLLFLFALLVVTSRFAPALKIITCFTLAHSITLAVATLGSVQMSSGLVEPLIAASIVYVSVENLLRGDDPKGRWLLTFAFGLIHGFGFASVLRELGVGSNGAGITLPLVSFNLGVELGQIMVAALALPVIWKLRTHPSFAQRWVPACSVLVAVLGGYWFIQRVWPG